MGAIRGMDVGERLTFSVDKWGAARAGAHYLARDFGSRFSVHRLPRNGQTIIVERLA